ncbi:MAG: hypothetical protein EOM80_08240 [Erysipelotrichia bacterium]|nr:hypothetical protein [Erysipelotrichia bacterium]
MDLCEKVNEFLEKDPPPDLTRIPDSLADHIRTCTVCSKTLGYFRDLAKDDNLRPLSLAETGDFMAQFQKNALANSRDTIPGKSSNEASLPWLNLKWALVILLFLVFTAGIWLFRHSQPGSSTNEEIQAFAVIKGKVTVLASSGSAEVSELNGERSLTSETEVKFSEGTDAVEIAYNNGGKVFLTGVAQMKVLKDGLNVETGKFNARFKNLAGAMKVRVPCAVLAIRGTEIAFDIHPPSDARITLLEGAVDLIPDNTSLPTIQLEKGKQVVLTSNVWTFDKPELHEPRKETPLENQNDGSQGRQGNNNDGIDSSSLEAEGWNTELGNSSSNSTSGDGSRETDYIGREGFRGN